MRTFTKIMLATGLALAVSSSASANWSLTLTQVGGTYSASLGASPGDTLILDIGYSTANPAVLVNSIAAAINLGAIATLNAGASTETGFAAWEGGGVSASPIATGDIQTNSGNAIGWEKASGIGTQFGTVGSCVFGACASMGTASLVLTGVGGVLDMASTIGMNGGTAFFKGGGDATNYANQQSLGTFTVVAAAIPEPTTASLLGLGLVGLTVAGRRRKN